MERLGAKADFFTTFHQLCARLLTPLERQVLQQALQAYRTSGNVADLVSETGPLWAAPSKLQLVPFVRQVVSLPDRHYFDALLGIHEGYVVRGPRSDVSKASSSLPSTTKSGNQPTAMRGGVHVIKVGNSASPRMGFSVRGGREFGLGIFISHVDPDSSAERAGLKCGDQILETNGVDLESATSEEAEQQLSRTHTHTLVVRRTRKIPEWKVTKERILWYDVASRKLVAAPSGEITSEEEPGPDGSSDIRERRVVLKLTRNTDFVGLNIRGGKDFGLGIYVSRVDPGGLAERTGVEVGDRLVQVNQRRLHDVSHASVVQLLRSHKQLVLTLWSVGRFPAYKELFTEFVWSDIGDFGDSASKGPLTHTAELHAPQPRVKARHRTGRVTQRKRARESRVDRSPRDSGIDLNGVDLPPYHPDPDYPDDDLDLDDLEDEDGLPARRERLFYPRDQDIIFRGSYAQNWRQLDQAEDAGSCLSEPGATSCSSSSRRRGATRGARAWSVAAGGADSPSSDEDMDYATFLQHKARRDEMKASTKVLAARDALPVLDNNTSNNHNSHNNSSYNNNNSSHSSHNTSQTARQSGWQTSGEDVIQVLPSSAENAEPTLLRATDRREPSSLGNKAAADRTERAAAAAATTTTMTSTTTTTTTSVVDREGDSVRGNAEEKADLRTEPVLVKTVIRVDSTTPGQGRDQVQTQALVTNRAVDRREERPPAELAQRGAARAGEEAAAQDADIYAVVNKPPRLLKQQHQQQQGPQTIQPHSSTQSPPAVRSSRSREIHSASSRSNSEDGDDDSNDDSNSSASQGQGRHHRTHIYHINSSPVTAKKPPRGEKKKHKRQNVKGDDDDDDEDFVVVTEVMAEVAIQSPSPSLDYRRSSIASSTSNSDSTVTGGGGEEGRTRKEESLSEEIRRLEARLSNIGSREISSLTEGPAAGEKRGKAEEDKKVGRWSALKKKLTSSMRIKKSGKQPRVTSSTNRETVSMGSIRRKGIFERSFGSQMMNQQTEEKYNLMMVEERARQLLPKDESDAVLRHVKKYQEERDLDRLVDVLTVILDKPQKLLLLKDVRGVVLPCHVGRFDSLVARHEQTTFDGASGKLHLPLSPMHHPDHSRSKPRSKLITTVVDSDGHFHIQSIDHEDRNKQLQIQVVDAFQGQVQNKALNNNYNNSLNNNNSSSSNTQQQQRQQQQQLQQQQQQQQQNVYNAGSNSGRGVNVNGVARHNRLNLSDVPHHQPLPEWMRDDVEVIIVEKAPMPPPPSPPPPEEGFVVYLSKQKKNLGLIICGGAGDHRDSSVRIEMVMPWGAAADDERIQSGMHILSVDDQPVKGLTQSEAIALLKRCFTDVRSVNMKLRLKTP